MGAGMVHQTLEVSADKKTSCARCTKLGRPCWIRSFCVTKTGWWGIFGNPNPRLAALKMNAYQNPKLGSFTNAKFPGLTLFRPQRRFNFFY